MPGSKAAWSLEAGTSRLQMKYISSLSRWSFLYIKLNPRRGIAAKKIKVIEAKLR